MTHTRTFNYDRETKNKIRFTEYVGSESDEIVGTLYVRKEFAKDAKQLTLTIELPE